MICPKCGKETQEGAFCSHCGSRLPLRIVCPRCGSSWDPKDGRFCPQCGKRSGRRRSREILPVVLAAAVGLVLLLAAWAFWFQRSPEQHENSENLVIQTERTQAGELAVPLQTETFAEYPSSTQEQAEESTEWEPVGPRRPIAVDGGNKHTAILYSDGTVTTIGDDSRGQRSTSGWTDIIQISTFADHTVGLKSDGTVVAAGANESGQCDVAGWRVIVAVAAGSRHTVGVKADGTVVAVGANQSGQCDVEGWENVRAVAASNTSTFALTNDGRVLSCGSFYNRNMNNWSDIVSISVSTNHVVGVHSNGTVSAVGSDEEGQCDNLEKWMDTKMVAVGYGYTAGLREKGTVWVHGSDEFNQHAAMQWSHIVSIGSGTEHIIGIREDGTLVAIGTDDCGQCDVYALNQMLES